MKRWIFVAGIVSLLLPAGCKHESAIWPHERVVTQPEKRDFGFVGTWRPVPDPRFTTDNKLGSLTVTMADDGVYTVRFENDDQHNVSLHAIALDEGSDYAIVDVEASLGIEALIEERGPLRLLGLAKRKDNYLYYCWIESKNLARLMNADGHSAVIEQGPFVTKVYAEPAQLVDCVRKHWPDLIGETRILQLQTPENQTNVPTGNGGEQ